MQHRLRLLESSRQPACVLNQRACHERTMIAYGVPAMTNAAADRMAPRPPELILALPSEANTQHNNSSGPVFRENRPIAFAQQRIERKRQQRKSRTK